MNFHQCLHRIHLKCTVRFTPSLVAGLFGISLMKTNLYKTLVSRYSVHSQKTWLVKSHCLPRTVRAAESGVLPPTFSGRCWIKILSATYQWVAWLEEPFLNRVAFHLQNEMDIFVTEKGKTVSQLQHFEFLTAVFLNIQVCWYIALCTGQVVPSIRKEFGAFILMCQAVDKQWLFLG